ncbi:MAG: TraR/DksA C4-type zinc finger protein [Candidatus Omnitrophota bacterium]|nr:TraR/DksA family transcriptional regulator [Candidatus Omnitrophota bacterium]MBU2528173.1 TraR/DksA C4-type zinc finger protein [bacterium]MBU3929551.1 TraR/DksA C4-type zinc finger protein [bacterium]MBU4122171.1 TraR/DksA C4-type zinc finger protein [bacterium]
MKKIKKKKPAPAKKPVAKLSPAKRSVCRGGSASGGKKKSAAVKKEAVKKIKQPSPKEKALRHKHLTVIVSQLKEEKLFVQERVEKAKRDEWMGSVNDEIDNAVASAERDILFERVDRLIQRLDEIDNALKKAQLKNFGICETCGMAISLKRLKLIPYARFCYRCISND